MSNVGTRTVCKKDMCAGCMACVDSCRHGAIAIEDTIEAYNARIDPTRCVGCGLCEKTCPQMVSPIFVASSRVATGVGERYIAQDVIFVRGSGYGHLGGVCGVKWISVFMCTGGR